MPRLNRQARRDFRFWPFKELVTLSFAGTGTAADVSVKAMRVPPEQRAEQRPMYGKYLVDNMTWLIPGPLLAAGTEIRPRDSIEANTYYGGAPAGTTDWTVISAQHNHIDEVWSLDCVELSIHPRLYDTISIERYTTTLDDANSEERSWIVAFSNVRCAVLYLGGDHTTDEGMVGDRERWDIVLGQRLALTERDRVVYHHPDGDLILDIEDYQDSTQLGDFPRIVAFRSP